MRRFSVLATGESAHRSRTWEAGGKACHAHTTVIAAFTPRTHRLAGHAQGGVMLNFF
jgi:hypothetical protein